MRIRHERLRALDDRDDAAGQRAGLAPWLRRILFRLQEAARLGRERGTLSRLLNGKACVSANMALALEDIGWGTAEHWMWMQASYELAQTRRGRPAAERHAACMTLHRASVGEQETVAVAAGYPWALPSANSRLSGTPLRKLPVSLGFACL